MYAYYWARGVSDGAYPSPQAYLEDVTDLLRGEVAELVRLGAGYVHVCRGNDANRYMARGGYEQLAEEVFPRTAADVLLLEYDDERSGGFEPLRHVSEDKVVVLGLVSTKRQERESEEELRVRIDEASSYVPLERLALSTQCGFASVAKGNDLTAEQEERKLELVARVASQVWG
ncbi:MAG: hypothetical protein ACRDNG_12900 [Gaiellaceae bacterium]